MTLTYPYIASYVFIIVTGVLWTLTTIMFLGKWVLRRTRSQRVVDITIIVLVLAGTILTTLHLAWFQAWANMATAG